MARSLKQSLHFLSELYIYMFTKRHGLRVGTDRFGNVYYKEKRQSGFRERRWVMFSGVVEASKVPAEWYGWLHHTHADPLPEGPETQKPWQKEHQPNLTGTSGAYHPPGSTAAGGVRAASSSDYEPWIPS